MGQAAADGTALAERAAAGGLKRLEPLGQWSAAGSECIDPLACFRIDGQRRRVMRLEASVDDQRTGAAPVLLLAEGADASDVGRRIRSREGDPEKVGERPGSEIAVIDDDEERKTVERARRFNCITKASD